MLSSSPDQLVIRPSVSSFIESIIPAGYREVSRLSIKVDEEPAELIRFQPEDTLSTILGSEHFSIITDSDGRIKGFTRMDMSLAHTDLPSQEEARIAAERLLSSIAPDLLNSAELHWIKPHSETITIIRGIQKRDVSICGMKVKMRNASDGRWFWVIIGSDRQAITFERDIVWITFPGHRKTEKWLHDSWLAKRIL